MNTRTLGRTGFEISEIGFGAWAIGTDRYGNVNESDARATIQAYLDAGGNFIDTARAYGESERILGEHFHQHGGRDRVFIASKSGAHDIDTLNQHLETSLRHLDYIDLYFLHSPPDDPDHMHQLLDAYAGFKREGKIRAIGASIKGPNVTQATVDLCRQYIATGQMDAFMLIYSITRQKVAEVFDACQSAGVGIVARTVLESGFLTGKYPPGTEFGDNDHRRRWSGDHLRRILEAIADLQTWAVQPPYESLTQVAVRFALDDPRIANVALGAKTPAQIESTLAVAEMPPLPNHESLVERYAGKTAMFNTGGS